MARIRIVIAAVLCSGIVFAQGAVLSGSGTVTVNGAQTNSAGVRPGDTILTGDNGVASITQRGANVVLSKKTTATKASNKLVLNQGSAAVATTTGFAVEAGSLTITPQLPVAHYEITRTTCRVTIVAHETALGLSDGTLIRADHTLTRAEPNCPADSANSGSSSNSAPSLSAARTAVILGTGTAAGATLGSTIKSDPPKASPSRPH